MNQTIGRICGLLLVVACLCCSGCAGAAVRQEESDTTQVLTIGSDIYSPYFYLGDDGSFTGIDVEIATEACRRMGMRAEFQRIEWQNKDTRLADGTVDCLWGSFSMNGREADYAWAGPYMHSRQVVVVLASSDIYTLSDLSGKRISVQNASKPDSLFSTDAIPGVSVEQVYSFSTMFVAFASLKKGYVDACAGHETALRDYMKHVSGEYRILDEYLLRSDLGVAFDKSTGTEQAARLSAVLEEMKADGTIRSILENYDLDIDFALKEEASDEAP